MECLTIPVRAGDLTSRAGYPCICPISWGVSFKIDERGMEILDKKEGVGIGKYRRIMLPNEQYSYSIVKETGYVPPSDEYLDVIICGAKEHHLSVLAAPSGRIPSRLTKDRT